MLSNQFLNPSILLYFIISIGIILKFFIDKINRKLLFFVPIFMLFGICVCFYYFYCIVDFTIGEKFLAGRDNLGFYENKYAIPIVYFIYFILLSVVFFGFPAKNNKMFVYSFYLISAINAITSGSLFIAFIFLEIMSICSIIIILIDAQKRDVAMIYVIIHCVSGVLMLVGVAGYALDTQDIVLTSISFLEMKVGWKMPMFLFLIGILMNLGFPPFSYVITECYTALESFSLIVISSVSTKIYLLFFINIFFGVDFLYIVGIAMILNSGICAIMNSDLRRIINHAAIMHIGGIIAFCSHKDGIDANVIGFSVLMSMIAMFFTSVLVGILYYIDDEYVRNIENRKKTISTLKIFIKYITIFFLCLHIMSVPYTQSSIIDASLKSNNYNMLNFISFSSRFFCFIVGAKILVKTILFFRSTETRHGIVFSYYRFFYLALPVLLAIFLTSFSYINCDKIIKVYSDHILHYEDPFRLVVVCLIIFAIVFILLWKKILKLSGKFGFDFVIIYNNIMLPIANIIKITILTIFGLFYIIFNIIIMIINKKIPIVNNENFIKKTFYETDSILILSIFIIIIIVSISALLF